ncbi:unnamed protein product [Ectocarpus sp. 12 AP-2014]
MKNEAVVILVITAIVSVYVGTRYKRGYGASGLVVKSASFDHQVADFIKFNGLRVPGVEPSGNGLYAVVLTKSLGNRKIKSASTFHVGVLKMNNFENRLADMRSFVDKKMNEGVGQLLVLFSIGTTHEKPVMEEMRNGIVADKYESAAKVLKLYGMKKFLSMAHGCRQPYILVHDLKLEETVVERTGICGGVLCAKV